MSVGRREENVITGIGDLKVPAKKWRLSSMSYSQIHHIPTHMLTFLLPLTEVVEHCCFH